jgi:hypothetical protein
MATFSQANEMRKFYAGIGVGSTALNDYDDLFNTLSVDEDGNTFKFIAGYQFNRIVALEA